nr:hypothetical protein [Tanacetum cinerariifolium]
MNGNPSRVNIKQLCGSQVTRTSKYDESNASALDDPTLRAGNLVKEILLKLKIPDYRNSIIYCKTVLMESEHYNLILAKSRFTTSCSIDKDKYMMKAQVSPGYEILSFIPLWSLVSVDHALWEVIVNGDSVSPVTSASAGAEGLIPPKTAEQKLARKNELKAKSTLMLAIPDEHLLKFHACKDAKSLWEAIKNRFGGNKESKKMQKTILKKNYENFVASSQEGRDKTYDSFQKLISQLEIHGEVISLEDANMKLLRSLPSAWNNIALIMSNKSNLDTLSMDDLYNNLKVYESEIKGQLGSSSNSQNVAFVSLENSSSTNETVNTAHSDSAASFKDQASTASYANDIDADDLEEMDLKWQVAMLTMRVKRFIKKTRRKLDLNGKETIGFDRTKVECYNYHMRGHFARECRAPRNQKTRNRDALRRNAPLDTSITNALVVQYGIDGYDWSF